MKNIKQNLLKFINTPVGVVAAFVLIFYLLTFVVYYFYSPGPEERNQAASQRVMSQ